MSYKSFENDLFNLKYNAKQLAKSSRKGEKEELALINKLKVAMKDGDMERARIFAEAAVLKKKDSIIFLRLSSRMEAAAARFEGALKTRQVSCTMGQIVKNMDKLLAKMDVEAISHCMKQFEEQFKAVDCVSNTLSDAVGASVATSTPEDEVLLLMQQVSDSEGLDIRQAMGIGVKDKIETNKAENIEELEKRLQQLSS